MDLLLSLLLACGQTRHPLAASAVASAPGCTEGAAPAGPASAAALPAPPSGPSFGAVGIVEPQRPRAIEMSEAYHVRLTIHYVASFLTLPLFAAEYVLGSKLYRDPPGPESTQQAHRLVALGVTALFAVNTVTGAWNLWDGRRTPQGRLRRYLHSALMFAADAGFVATGATAPGPRRVLSTTRSARNLHRTVAIASMGTALASYAMMLVWRD